MDRRHKNRINKDRNGGNHVLITANNFISMRNDSLYDHLISTTVYLVEMGKLAPKTFMFIGMHTAHEQ
jgi:hypothetical protein